MSVDPPSLLAESDRTRRMAVLISGSGRTLENLLRVIERGELGASVCVVISSVPGVRGLEIAASAGIAAITVRRSSFGSLEAYSKGIHDAASPYAPHFFVMAGFLRKLLVFPGWENRILNIHPALLPEAAAYAAGKGMFGARVHEAVIRHGDTVSGATVHLVTDDYDEGPPLGRAEVPVFRTDTPATLARRVFHAECALYPTVIREFIDRLSTNQPNESTKPPSPG